MDERITAGNSTYPKGVGSYSNDSFVIIGSLDFQIKFCGKNPALRVAAKRCKNNLEREFYILATRKFGWTKNILINQIGNQAYQKYLLNQTNLE